MTLKMEPKLIKIHVFMWKTYHQRGTIDSTLPHIYTQTRQKVQGVITLKNLRRERTLWLAMITKKVAKTE